MADSKITALTALTAADPANDMIPIVDVSDTPPASGNTKRISINNLLACSPSATLASATISGDLTVRTDKLKVDASGVGVNTTSTTLGGGVMAIEHASNNGLVINSTAGSPTLYLRNVADSNLAKLLFTDNGLTFDTANGGTRMTLNATGLGVGVSPNDKLTVLADNYLSFQTSTLTFNSGRVGRIGAVSSGSGNGYLVFETYKGGSGGGERMRIDSDGNVGIGVTPSAWSSDLRALQVSSSGSYLTSYISGATVNQWLFIGNNAFYDTVDSRWEYIRSKPSAQYIQYNNEHQWLRDTGTQTAGAACSFTQAMTLDASGNLLVGKTASSSTAVGAELRPSGAIISTLAASTNADFALYTYSTGAGAARFYVGMSGTVFATNTTISAISDQRLKENVQDIDVGLGAILALKPRKFDWKTGKGKDIKGDRGFIAQEFETVFPQLVDEWADPAPEGEAPYKSVRQDLIPVLVKAIQELTARVQTLEAK